MPVAHCASPCPSVGLGAHAPAFITMAHLVPDVDEELQAFRDYCEERFAGAAGSVGDAAWRALLNECLKPDFEAKLRKVEFTQAARVIGFKGNAEVVFEACDLDHAQCISVHDFRFLQIGDNDPPPIWRSEESCASV